MDWCDLGTGLDLPFVWLNRWQEDENPSHSCGDVQLFSGCQDNQTSSGSLFTCFTSTKVQILTIRRLLTAMWSDSKSPVHTYELIRVYVCIYEYVYVLRSRYLHFVLAKGIN
jgi:hypothetical protein